MPTVTAVCTQSSGYTASSAQPTERHSGLCQCVRRAGTSSLIAAPADTAAVLDRAVASVIEYAVRTSLAAAGSMTTRHPYGSGRKRVLPAREPYDYGLSDRVLRHHDPRETIGLRGDAEGL